MRRVLALAVVLLVVTILLRFGDRLNPRTERRPEAGLDFVLAARGPLLPARRVGIRGELHEAILAGDRLLVEDRDAPPGLRVATFGAGLELLDYRSFDVGSSGDEALAFRRWIVDVPIPAVCALVSSGAVAPPDTGQLAREALEETRTLLRARARPFDANPCSWAFLAVRLRSGWVPLTEVYSEQTGVVAAFTLAPDLSRYRGHRGDFVVLQAQGPQTVELTRELVHAVQRDADVTRAHETQVGGVARSGLLFRSAGRIEWHDVSLGTSPFFETLLGVPDGASRSSGGVCELGVDGEVIARRSVDPGVRKWTAWRVDLTRFSGTSVVLSLEVKPSANRRPAPIAWVDPRLVWSGTGGS